MLLECQVVGFVMDGMYTFMVGTEDGVKDDVVQLK